MREGAMRDGATTMTPAFCEAILVAAIVALTACASGQGQGDGYSAFLNRIAAECKPLVIGSDNIGQAIVFNGLGAIPENYNNFLAKTSALYNGTISPQLYRDSLTSFIGSGTSNQRSFDCIIAHLPSASPPPAH